MSGNFQESVIATALRRLVAAGIQGESILLLSASFCEAAASLSRLVTWMRVQQSGEADYEEFRRVAMDSADQTD
jgi:hypothetical protein